MNKTILLNNRPVGRVSLSNFKFGKEEIPTAEQGEILLKSLYVSIDPYLRGRMNEGKTYIPAFELNKPIQSYSIAKVIESKHPGFNKDEFVIGMLAWKEYQVSSGEGLKKIVSEDNNLSAYLGILGITGLTAYFGLTEIGIPKSGETLIVSGAGGAVGNVVGQIGKILGCKVVGITGSDHKVDFLKSKFKFDDAINYKTQSDLQKAIKNVCPDGIDVYYDNVGGEISDAVLSHLNKYARIVICGNISQYNETSSTLGPRVQSILLGKSAIMHGFTVSDFTHKFHEASIQLGNWLHAGKLINEETIINGFDNIPNAFLGLFEGKKQGKMIVKI